MTLLNKQQFHDAQLELWNQRESLSLSDFSKANDALYARFEMRIDDLIEHLQEIKNDKGNIKILKEDLYAGTMHLSNIHLQKRKDTNDEWIVSLY